MKYFRPRGGMENFLKSLRHIFFRLSSWYFRAFSDVIAQDCGADYQGIATALWAGGSACMAASPFLVAELGGGIGVIIAVFTCLYLLFGLFFLSHEREWNGKI